MTQAPLSARFPSLRDRAVFVTGLRHRSQSQVHGAFAAQGARVAFIDVAEAASRALAEQVQAAGHAAPWWRACDVRDIAALQAAIADAATALGSDFHALVNNVANDDRHSLESVTPDYFDERMAINQRPAFFAIQAVVPGMQRLGGGSIVNLGSTGWQAKGTGYPCYAIAKSSVNGLTRGLATNLGEHRIRVNTVSPGWVMTQRQIDKWLTPEGDQERLRLQCLPDKLLGEDIAAMVLFLAADEGRMCTAQEFKVDAGWA